VAWLAEPNRWRARLLDCVKTAGAWTLCLGRRKNVRRIKNRRWRDFELSLRKTDTVDRVGTE